MKKILLATTALAVVGVVAPASADTNISAFYEFGWASFTDDSNVDDKGTDSHTFQNSEVHFKFSTVSDNGLEFGATFELEGVADGSTSVDSESGTASATVADKVNDESAIYVAGDFGRLVLGQDDFAHNNFLTWSPTTRGTYGQDDGHYGPRFKTANPTQVTGAGTGLAVIGNNATYSDAEKISYFSPNFSGFEFGASWTDSSNDDGAGTDKNADISYGASYSWPSGAMIDNMSDNADGASMGMMDDLSFKVTAAALDNGEGKADRSESASLGLTIEFSDIAFSASSAAWSSGDGADKKQVDATEFGIGYTVSESISVGVAFTNTEVSKGKVAEKGIEQEVASIGLDYTIVPGLSAAIAFNQFEVKNPNDTTSSNDGSNMVLSLKGSF